MSNSYITQARSTDKRTFYLLLLFIILLAFTIRYPYLYVPHEAGADTFYYHTEVNSLLTFHEWTWFLHPLSIFGFYAYSDSSGVPFYLSEIILLTGLPSEGGIILFDYLIVLVGVINVFILGFKIKKSLIFSTFIGMAFILAPKSINPTILSITERGALLMLVPFWMLLMIYILKNDKKEHKYSLKMILLLALSSLVLLSIHRIFIFAASFLIAYLILKIFLHIKNKNQVPYILIRYSPFIVAGLFILAFFSLYILNEFIVIPGFDIANYEESAFFKGNSYLIILLNIGVSLVGGSGILFTIFAPIGVFYLIFKKNKDRVDMFILISTLTLMPFITNRVYVRPFFVSIASIFMAYGSLVLINLYIKHINFKRCFNVQLVKRFFIVLLIISILISISFSGYIVNRWQDAGMMEASKRPYGMTEYTYSTSIWFKYNAKGIFVSNFMSRGFRIQAYSNNPMLPGLYSTVTDNIVLYKLFKNESELRIKFNKWLSTEIYTNVELVREMRRDYVYTMVGKNENTKVLEKYNTSYFVFYRKMGYVWEGWSGIKIYKSSFCKRTTLDEYKIYANDDYFIMHLTYDHTHGG